MWAMVNTPGKSCATVTVRSLPSSVAMVTLTSWAANSAIFWRQPPQGGTGSGLSAITSTSAIRAGVSVSATESRACVAASSVPRAFAAASANLVLPVMVFALLFGIGVAVGGAQDSGVATLLRKADEMMYQEKRRSGQRVVDGDSLWVRPPGGAPVRLRLAGLDAPEICQPGGTASRDALARRAMHQRVVVVVRREDDYGRGLARLESAGEDTNAWLVRAGWGAGQVVTAE